MESKKKYYKLDDIGFVGTQKKISASDRKRMDQLTAKAIREYKAAKGASTTTISTSSKAKRVS